MSSLIDRLTVATDGADLTEARKPKTRWPWPGWTRPRASKWDREPPSKRVFYWATPARGPSGPAPKPWRVSDTYKAMDYVRGVAPSVSSDLYAEPSGGERHRGCEQIWIGLRDNRDKTEHKRRLTIIHDAIKKDGKPVRWTSGKGALWIMDDLKRDALREDLDEAVDPHRWGREEKLIAQWKKRAEKGRDTGKLRLITIATSPWVHGQPMFHRITWSMGGGLYAYDLWIEHTGTDEPKRLTPKPVTSTRAVTALRKKHMNRTEGADPEYSGCPECGSTPGVNIDCAWCESYEIPEDLDEAEEILRSSFSDKTKVFLVFDSDEGQYAVRSRFQDYYRSRKGLKPNSAAARRALKTAEGKFEGLLGASFVRRWPWTHQTAEDLDEGNASEIIGNPKWEAAFKAGFAHAKKTGGKKDAAKEYRTQGRSHGASWIEGYKGWIDVSRGAKRTTNASVAKKLGLCEDQELDEARGQVVSLTISSHRSRPRYGLQWMSRGSSGGSRYDKASDLRNAIINQLVLSNVGETIPASLSLAIFRLKTGERTSWLVRGEKVYATPSKSHVSLQGASGWTEDDDLDEGNGYKVPNVPKQSASGLTAAWLTRYARAMYPRFVHADSLAYSFDITTRQASAVIQQCVKRGTLRKKKKMHGQQMYISTRKGATESTSGGSPLTALLIEADLKKGAFKKLCQKLRAIPSDRETPEVDAIDAEIKRWGQGLTSQLGLALRKAGHFATVEITHKDYDRGRMEVAVRGSRERESGRTDFAKKWLAAKGWSVRRLRHSDFSNDFFALT